MVEEGGEQAKPRCCILIIGGGLAGLATAIALRLANHEAIVFERAPELKEVGDVLGVLQRNHQLTLIRNRSVQAFSVHQMPRFSSNAGGF